MTYHTLHILIGHRQTVLAHERATKHGVFVICIIPEADKGNGYPDRPNLFLARNILELHEALTILESVPPKDLVIEYKPNKHQSEDEARALGLAISKALQNMHDNLQTTSTMREEWARNREVNFGLHPRAFQPDPALIIGGGPSANILDRLYESEAPTLCYFTTICCTQAWMAFGRMSAIAVNVDSSPAHAKPFIDGPSCEDKELWCSGSSDPEILSPEREWGKIRISDAPASGNVVGFALQMAYYLGYNPLVIIGCDLAHPGEYVPGYAPENPLHYDDPPVSVLDWNGDQIKTMAVYKGFGEWLASFTVAHPDRTYINCSVGGMKLGGNWEHMTLEECAKKVGGK